MYDVLIVGSGFAGSTAARLLAEKGKKVRIIEKRNAAGGNAYDCPDKDGVPVHIYGPHIFHTNSEEVYSFITRFGNFKKYEHRVLGYIDGKFVPIPFNYKSMEMLTGDKADTYKTLLENCYGGRKSVAVNELLENENADIRELGELIFQKVFVNYTAKQWGVPAMSVDKSVLGRVPVVLGYDDRYFHDKYQLMPEACYSDIFKSLLSHENIELSLNTEACNVLSMNDGKIYADGKPFEGDVIYTGAIDELFDYVYGELPYRSVHMQFENVNTALYQPAAVVNYPNDNDFTRITEFKHFYDNKGKHSTILKEFPLPYDKNGRGNIPYYVILGEENTAKYLKYKDLADNIHNLHFVGRLAEYKYYNMDAAILAAINLINNKF